MTQVGIYCSSTTDQSKSPGVQQSNLPSDDGYGDGRDALARLEGGRPGPSSQEGNTTPEPGARPLKSSPRLRPGDHSAYTPRGASDVKPRSRGRVARRNSPTLAWVSLALPKCNPGLHFPAGGPATLELVNRVDAFRSAESSRRREHWVASPARGCISSLVPKYGGR